MTDDTTDALGLTRRQALVAAAALCGFGAVAVGTAGAAQASGSLRVQLSQYPELKKVGGIALVGDLGSTPVAVVRTGTNKYIALNRRCPHAGVAVTPRGRGFVCLPPGHGSVFTDTGAKVSGLTPTGLRKLKATLSRGVLTITG
ncbi:MAG: Rieske 2Fe-2S domain-containing protein [Actinobacteria bacterium]|nr:Rieske 2Fe-2S domain-containing protein [Actinomycetota bacterium]